MAAGIIKALFGIGKGQMKTIPWTKMTPELHNQLSSQLGKLMFVVKSQNLKLTKFQQDYLMNQLKHMEEFEKRVLTKTETPKPKGEVRPFMGANLKVVPKGISDEAATSQINKLRADLPSMNRNELNQLVKDVINRKAYASFDDAQRKELLEAIEYQTTHKPDFASGGIARLALGRGGAANWFITTLKALIDEAANPGPWSRFSKMGAKDKQAAIADAQEMIKNLQAGDPVPEYLLEDIVANPKFKLKRSKTKDPDLAEVENLVEGYNKLKLAREKKFRGPIEDFRTGDSTNYSAALDDYDLFTPITKDMYGKTWKGKKNWIKEERAKIKKTQETIGPAPSSRHPNYESMKQIRNSLEDRLTALDITEELGGNIKMYDKLRMHNYPTYKQALDRRDWLMPPGGLRRREAFVIDIGHDTLPPVKKAEGGIAGELHLNQGGRIGYARGTKKFGEGQYSPTKGKDWIQTMPMIDPNLRELMEEYKKRKGLSEILGV